ncbi:MAG: 1,4-alpha-glucan branching enzyme, partial [Verrucomicrobiota bacterium]
MNPSLLADDDFYPLIEARHSDPFRILGLREFQGRWIGRVFRPDAAKVRLVAADGKAFELTRIHEGGLFEAVLPGVTGEFGYTLEFTDHDGTKWRSHDPYSFGPVLGEMDIYLFNEGTHYDIYKKLGAHVMEIGGVPGVHFSVWAPSAQRVSVAGDFNGWDGRVHPMRKMVPSGVWEIFLPGVHEGAHYKFEIRGPHGEVFLKTDPYAFFAQHTIETGCMVFDLNRFGWSDSAWMEKRKQRDPYASPMSIYEVHLGSW